MSYLNVDNWVVILDDGRDPHLSFSDHRKRGSLGGVDCVAAVGTPVHAPCDGTAYIGLAGTGGRTITLAQADGWHDQFMHLSRYAVANGTAVKQGDLLGYTGASGVHPDGTVDDNYYVPHLHWHRIDPSGVYRDDWGTTNRRVPWDYFDSGISGAGSGTVTPIELEVEMTYDEFRDFLRRGLKYDVREFETTGATLWERIAALATAIKKTDVSDESAGGGWKPFRDQLWRFLKYHSREDGPDSTSPTIFERLRNIEDAVKANGKVTLVLDAASAKLIADQIKVPTATGPTAAEIATELAKRLSS